MLTICIEVTSRSVSTFKSTLLEYSKIFLLYVWRTSAITYITSCNLVGKDIPFYQVSYAERNNCSNIFPEAKCSLQIIFLGYRKTFLLLATIVKPLEYDNTINR